MSEGQTTQPTPHAPQSPPPKDLDGVVAKLVASYRSDERLHHLESTFLPSRACVIEIIELLRRLVFPGFFDDCRVGLNNVEHRAHTLLSDARDLLYEQTRQVLRYDLNRTSQTGAGDERHDLDSRAIEITDRFIEELPELRALLATDVQAAYDGDPAAKSTDEIIFCYPGLDAIFTHRVAHALYKLEVPLIPRIMAEYAHNETGVELHPGATIGESFFIDHGTGVVVGETTTIGKRCKLYQGVTLGALSTKGGQSLRDKKRHPTLEDDVTIYGGAIILGGDTVIGKGATVGGSVFITESIPAGHTVTMKMPELKMRAPRGE